MGKIPIYETDLTPTAENKDGLPPRLKNPY